MITERQQKIMRLLVEISAETEAMLEEYGNMPRVGIVVNESLHAIQTNILALPIMKEIGWSNLIMNIED